jgi:ABC-2 type transport system ATP-binding protein
MDAIVVEDLRKSYGDVQALDGISFTVGEGEVFGLLGPNGAGKTTTVKVLATLTKPDSGRAEVVMQDVVKDPNGVRRSIGYVPQGSGVDRDATGRENLMLQGRIQRMHGAQLKSRVNELLRLVGIEDSADRVVRGYSGGMKRRLDVALGLVHRPRVVYLDEPTTGLDPEARVSMWDELGRIAGEEALTILLTTHYLEEADRLANRLAIVSRGHVVVEGTPNVLKQSLEGDSVIVELSDGNTPEARAIIESLDGIREVRAEGRQLRSRVDHGARAIPQILSALDRGGIAVEAVDSHRPSLDDVYLHYTGRDFREEDEAVAE